MALRLGPSDEMLSESSKCSATDVVRASWGSLQHNKGTSTLAMSQIARHFGMEESLEDLIIARRLTWLGHVARMNEERIPKT